jgi:hypothetical protein
MNPPLETKGGEPARRRKERANGETLRAEGGADGSNEPARKSGGWRTQLSFCQMGLRNGCGGLRSTSPEMVVLGRFHLSGRSLRSQGISCR